jgi:hypothetical protein
VVAEIEAGRGSGSLYHGNGALLMVALEREGDREANEQEGGGAAGEAHLVAAHRGRGTGNRGSARGDLSARAPSGGVRSGEGRKQQGREGAHRRGAALAWAT